jgi:hypothetical protein
MNGSVEGKGEAERERDVKDSYAIDDAKAQGV